MSPGMYTYTYFDLRSFEPREGIVTVVSVDEYGSDEDPTVHIVYLTSEGELMDYTNCLDMMCVTFRRIDL